MALTLVKETGAGLTTANSYATAAEGDTYHDKHAYATTWTGATTANKEAALVMATRLLDEGITWAGTRNTKDQALEWPRVGAYDRGGWAIDNDELPTLLVDATAEMARWLLSSDRTAEAGTEGFSSLKVGTLALVIDKGDRKNIIPPVVLRMLEPVGRAGTGGTRRLVRA